MSTTQPNQLIESLNWRYATKGFDPNKAIPEETREALEEALRLTPSSFGLQPWKFIVIQNPEIQSELKPNSWNQVQITDAPCLIVLAAKTKLAQADIDAFIAHTAETRNQPLEELDFYKGMIEGFTKQFDDAGLLTWASKQVYIALGNLLTSASLLGVDACPLEGIDPVKYDEILNLKEEGYSTVVACALGYRADDDKYATAPKVRFPAAQVITHK